MGGGVLPTVWERGCTIGKGTDFHHVGIRNGIDFQDFDIRYKVRYPFRKICVIKLGKQFRKEDWYKVRYSFSQNWLRNGDVFEVWIARL